MIPRGYKFGLRKSPIPFTKEHRNNISNGLKGRVVSQETRTKIRNANMGHPVTKEMRYKMSIAKLGKPRPPITEEHRKNLGLAKLGNKYGLGGKAATGYRFSAEQKLVFSLMHRGEKNHNWIKDRTKLKGNNSEERRSSAYNEWRKRVWERDGYKCRLSDENCKGRIEAHHIFSFTDYPNVRNEIENGITLCHFHHPRKKEEAKQLEPKLLKITMIYATV